MSEITGQRYFIWDQDFGQVFENSSPSYREFLVLNETHSAFHLF